MQNSTFPAENGACPDWGRTQLRSGERMFKAGKMRSLSKVMEVKENSKAKEIVGWLFPTKDWRLWVEKLSSVHKTTWKNAGIYEAIMSSIYNINRHDELILELISRWCSKTSTFVFPWGDATLTLEDTLVLGGFSASGLSISSCAEDDDTESVKIKEQLEAAKHEILSSKCRSRHAVWIKKFMGTGHELEHAAFLSVWLSKFVFSTGSFTNMMVQKSVFPLAARLSRGTKIALGPVVLAMLYAKLTSFTKMKSGESSGSFDFRAPFHLVQIWAWERLPIVKCLHSSNDLPRIARWSKVKIPQGEKSKPVLDSCGERFLWRPYGASSVRADTDSESFALCMKACEIVGFDSCVEKYQPQYVIRQFGFGLMSTTTTISPVESRKSKVENKKLLSRASTFQPTIATVYEKSGNKRRELTALQMKVASEVDYGPPPGFPVKLKDIAMEVVKSSVHGSSNAEGVAMEVENGSADELQGVEHEVDAGSCTKGRSMGSGFELEARIRRLEDILYEHMSAMEADN